MDQIIDYQRYPVKAAEVSTKARRSLGIGYIGLAHYLAKNGVKYNDPKAWELVDRLSEAFQYYLLRASCDLAEEKGKCTAFDKTKYADGYLPLDHYKKEVDKIVKKAKNKAPETALRYGTLTAAVSFIVLSYYLITEIELNFGIWVAVLSGAVGGIIIGLTTEYFTGGATVKKIAGSAETGPPAEDAPARLLPHPSRLEIHRRASGLPGSRLYEYCPPCGDRCRRVEATGRSNPPRGSCPRSLRPPSSGAFPGRRDGS